MDTQEQTGFTLLELMITIGILGVLAAIAIPAYNGYIKTSHTTECHNEVAAIKLAETEYYLDNNSYFGGASPGQVGVANIATASNNMYVPSTAASSANTECTYSVTSTATSYTITATGAASGHLTSGATIVQITGP